MSDYLVHTIHRSVVIQRTSTVVKADSPEQAEHLAIYDDGEGDIEFDYQSVISEEVTDVELDHRRPTREMK